MKKIILVLSFLIFVLSNTTIANAEDMSFEQIGLELAKASLNNEHIKLNELGNEMSSRGGRPKTISHIKLDQHTLDVIEMSKKLKDEDFKNKKECAYVTYELAGKEYSSAYCK